MATLSTITMHQLVDSLYLHAGYLPPQESIYERSVLHFQTR